MPRRSRRRSRKRVRLKRGAVSNVVSIIAALAIIGGIGALLWHLRSKDPFRNSYHENKGTLCESEKYNCYRMFRSSKNFTRDRRVRERARICDNDPECYGISFYSNAVGGGGNICLHRGPDLRMRSSNYLDSCYVKKRN
mgnify:CR=1 FL=1